MSIKPPMCKMCGHTHYGLEHVFEGKQPSHPLVDVPMLKPVRKPVKEVWGDNNAILHAGKEPVPRSVAPSKLRALEAEVEALTGEVAMLKRKLAEKPVDTTAKRRVDTTVETTCPVCEARKKAKAAAQKKWRKK